MDPPLAAAARARPVGLARAGQVKTRARSPRIGCGGATGKKDCAAAVGKVWAIITGIKTASRGAISIASCRAGRKEEGRGRANRHKNGRLERQLNLLH